MPKDDIIAEVMTPSGGEQDSTTARRTLRGQAIRARETLTATARAALTVRLEHHLGELLERLAPRRLGFCWPHRGEPDLHGFVARWLAADAGREAALPVVHGRDEAMSFRRWTPGMVLVQDRHGIPHPAEGDELRPDALLVPLNAFDAAGFRLGYGGGYFDRTLAVLDTIAIGVGFELGRVATVHPQPHDRPMHWLVTERGVFAPQPGPAGTSPAAGDQPRKSL